jgi:hypothetical protein
MLRITSTPNQNPTCFGFRLERSSTHTSRTMMLEELRELLSYVDHPEAGKVEYRRAIDDENCLGKRSSKTRLLTYRHLSDLYALDPSLILFRTLVYFWQRDPCGQPLLALLCACARDSILRSTVSFILPFPEGATVTREALEAFIDAKEPGRFSKATLTSTAQNINATWTQAGHLTGRRHKVRAKALPTTGSVSYALLLGYLTGSRGQALFTTDYARLLDVSGEQAMQLAAEASRRGWIVFKRVGEVIEVLFPHLIHAQEMEWIREQN